MDHAPRAQVEKPIELPEFQAQQRIQELPTLLEQDCNDAGAAETTSKAEQKRVETSIFEC
jgi:hypothetical protein